MNFLFPPLLTFLWGCLSVCLDQEPAGWLDCVLSGRTMNRSFSEWGGGCFAARACGGQGEGGGRCAGVLLSTEGRGWGGAGGNL